jgi:hypothetical protein
MNDAIRATALSVSLIGSGSATPAGANPTSRGWVARVSLLTATMSRPSPMKRTNNSAAATFGPGDPRQSGT